VSRSRNVRERIVPPLQPGEAVFVAGGARNTQSRIPKLVLGCVLFCTFAYEVLSWAYP